MIVVEKTSTLLLKNKTLNKELVLRLSKTKGFDVPEPLLISKAAERKKFRVNCVV